MSLLQAPGAPSSSCSHVSYFRVILYAGHLFGTIFLHNFNLDVQEAWLYDFISELLPYMTQSDFDQRNLFKTCYFWIIFLNFAECVFSLVKMFGIVSENEYLKISIII